MIDPGFPLIDLHRHLDGSTRLQTVLDLGRQHNLPLPAWDLEGLRPYVQVTQPQPGVMAFIKKFEWLTKILVDYDACHRIAYENVLDAGNEGIDYVELRFSPYFMAEANELDPEGVVEAIVEGVRQGIAESQIQANLIGIISRTYGPDIGWEELNALLAFKEHIAALDLAGDEANWPGDLFVEHFHKARDAGWQITVHAGEAAGSESIWQAINELGAQRIGHAVRALSDPALLDYMRENRIGIEANLTSNVQTSTVEDYESHPLRSFLEAGLLATINSDDPGISGIDLIYEYQVAAPMAGLSQEQIHKAQYNALEIAFLDEKSKKRLLESQTRDIG